MKSHLNLIVQGFLITGVLVARPLSAPLSAQEQVQSRPPLSCQTGNLVKSELYFGLSKANGERITEAEWQQFLTQVVTPRFHEGLTVTNAYGQYLNRANHLVVEPSKLVILVHQSQQGKEGAIAEIISAYKTKFHQESVLRVSSCIQASFD